MTKKALSVLAMLLVAGAIFAGFKYIEQPEEKDKVIISLVNEGLTTFHYSPKILDDELSVEVMKLYLESLDRNKLFLLESDVQELEKYNTLLDDEFKSGSNVFFDLSFSKLQNGLDRADGYYHEILSEPFDFEMEDKTWNNPEKLSWAKDQKELKDYWRKYLKWRVANRVYNKEQNVLDDIKNGEEVDPFVFEKAEKEAREDELEMMDEWFETLNDMERTEWLSLYVNSLTSVFDPHTEYMAPPRQENFEEQMTGQFEGIGAQLRQDGDYITVEKIITGSASWRQGELAPGDKIMQVAQGDEEPVDIVGWKISKAVKIIRGKKGTEVRLTVKRKDGSRAIIPIVRDVVEIESTYAKSAILGENKEVGYIRLPAFYVDFYSENNHNCTEDVKQEIIKLKEEGVEGLVFDLRSNGGGSLEAAIEIVGLFIERGPVVQVKSYQGAAKIKSNRDARVYWDGPLVVLVNDYSASASEIFAAAIQDYQRGLIMGTKSTFGKGTVQNMIDLDKAVRGNANMKPLGALKVTTDKFYRINGGTTQLQGVESDIVFPDAFEFVKTGEKEYDFALPFDEIAKANYSVYSGNKQKFDHAIKSSQARINSNPKFTEFMDYAKWLEVQNEDREIDLQYATFKAMHDKSDAVAEKYKNLNKSEDSTAVWALQTQLIDFKTDTVKQTEYKRWFKSLSKDLYLQEALNVVSEIK